MRRRFRLAQLLKYRKLIEDQRRTALAMIKGKQYREEEKLFHIQETQRSYQQQLQNTQGKTSLHLSYLDALSQDNFFQRKILQELHGQALKATDELVEASKSRKTVEKLRDKKMEQYKQYMIQQERKELDELAAGRFVRMNSASKT